MPNQHLPAKASTADYLHLHFIVLVWGFSSIMGYMITVPAIELVFLRTFIAAALTLAWLWAEKQSIGMPTSEKLILMAVGVLTAAHWFTFFEAARISNVSTSLAGLSTCTFFTSLLEPMLTRKKFSWVEFVFGLVVASGLYIIYMSEIDKAAGLLVGILSAFLAALFSVLNGRFIQKYPARVISFYELGGSTISAGLVFAIWFADSGKSVASVTPNIIDWGLILLLAGLCTVYAFSASLGMLNRFSVFTMNLIISLEPVYGIILAVLIFGQAERMTPQFYVGTAIILFSVLSFPILEKRTVREVMP